ncbi:GNAT family N-acetyltransferase [Flaviflagellibacter deserti]|jgi:[ribosomal protein S5]-alanine N-acetyltransferase|uniref:GNAT family N-acetyltransferase n=1 Tax=Flaviflagellibacter deserti TaxID=2267266 RepID=A0ABV9YX73_9HYPH
MAFLRALSDEQEPVLRGEGVTLRPPAGGDFEEWSDLRGRSRAFLKPWEPIWPADDLTRSAFRRRLRRYADERRSDSAYCFFVFGSESSLLLGGLTLSNIRRGVAQSCTLGYWMGEQFAGKGHMTAAVRAVVPFVFDRLALRRIEAACLPTNTASIRLLEKVGFVREGYARQYLCIDGIWQDHLLFALLRDDGLR